MYFVEFSSPTGVNYAFTIPTTVARAQKKSFHMLIHSDAIELGDHLLLWEAAGRGGSSVGRGRISLLFR